MAQRGRRPHRRAPRGWSPATHAGPGGSLGLRPRHWPPQPPSAELDDRLAPILASARRLLDAPDPLEAELLASLICLAAPELDEEYGRLDAPSALEIMIHGLARSPSAPALAILLGLAAVADEPYAAAAAEGAERLQEQGVPPPAWLEDAGRAEVVGCWLVSHPLGDGENVLLGCRYPSGAEHTVLAYIDHNGGSLVKDAFVGGPAAELVEDFRRLAAEEPDTAVEPLSPASAAARLRSGLAVTDLGLPAVETDSYPDVRALLDARLRTLPAGMAPAPARLAPAERDELVAEFLAAEGRAWAAHGDGAAIAWELLRFRCDDGDGRALRWSPAVVELLLTEWFFRAVPADAAFYALTPSVLRDWIRFAGRRSGLAARHVQATLAAVDRFEPQFLTELRRPPAWRQEMALLDLLRERGMAPTPERAPTAERPFDWTGIRGELHERVERIVGACDQACDRALDGEYKNLARALVARLARQRPSPLRRGDPTIWAGGVLYALGQLNYLFSRHAALHLPAKALAEAVGANLSSISQKAKSIREQTPLREGDPAFTRAEIIELGPLAHLYRYGLNRR
ncbi:MAG: DUF6398 domain-containing protein [Acidimicrobiales bacterium]